ncbi:WSC domain-containing protein 2-like [Lytechinus variegatus]|uniref:WSC domain-containing protein 2-like n=1 Tax=Lytechinus variegatus TaxID=7654 RepID=UPI001BB25A77|nr:WSC domain-containing protein 2-like [Lytechinus variegatus]
MGVDEMNFRCNRRCFPYCGPFRFREVFLAVSVFFMLGYFVGTYLNLDPMDGRLPLPDKAYRQTAERSSEIEDNEEEKTTQQKEEYVSSLNKTWLTWDKIDSPGVYRACVKRPEPEAMREVITGQHILQDTADKLTIEACIEACIQLVFTYAALSRGRECYCTDVSMKSQFLSYVDSALCDVRCTGDRYHNCGGDNYMSVYRTSVPDARCSTIELGAPGSFPLIALASYPRSGNTWTRQLIEKATGIYTGSVYWAKESQMEISKKVFLGGNVDYKKQSTICVKTHMHDREKFLGAIMLIRNPYRAIVAEVFRKQLFESKVSPEQAIKFFKSTEWNKFVNEAIENWKSMNMHWIQTHKRFLPMFYEELEAETVRKLMEIVVFLNRPVEPERIVCATQDHPSSLATSTSLGNHGRKTRVYLTEDPFTSEMHQKIDQSIQLVNKTLFKFHRKVVPAEYLKKTDVF